MNDDSTLCKVLIGAPAAGLWRHCPTKGHLGHQVQARCNGRFSLSTPTPSLARSHAAGLFQSPVRFTPGGFTSRTDGWHTWEAWRRKRFSRPMTPIHAVKTTAGVLSVHWRREISPHNLPPSPLLPPLPKGALPFYNRTESKSYQKASGFPGPATIWQHSRLKSRIGTYTFTGHARSTSSSNCGGARNTTLESLPGRRCSHSP
jgi:hypothetical protein